MKHISELFTPKEIAAAKGKTHAELLKVVEPLMPRIDAATGQTNLLAYMAYALEYAASINRIP